MKILEKAKMIDGAEIQLEDWSGKLEIGAYPIAKRNSEYNFIKAGKTFRLTISADECQNYANSDVKADFEALKAGKKTLEELARYFWNQKRDAEMLGM